MPALSGERGAGVDALTSPFRPRFARLVTIGLAVLVLVSTVAIMLAMSVLSTGDRIGFALVGGLIVWFLWRQASVTARVDDDGLTVRNLVFTRRLEWAEIVSVRFGSGRPWVQLDLSDGDTLAVMGIQRADGAFADAEARRLATLVAMHTATARDD
ncbi:PH domain-containing protein [Cellulomonas sp.]|uniref:PH domain-containing protein n=1 Tax=Cellulomonas sp. TaxID=40001 RepID=UPI003BAD716D